MDLLSLLLLPPALVLLVLSAFGSMELALLTFGAILPRKARPAPQKTLQQLVVVVPAHNESAGIGACVRSLLASQPPACQWRVQVIADNCADDTAEQARQAGAEVWERFDEELRGKGYALDYAFNRLLAEDVDAMLVVDADTEVADDFLRISAEAFASGADAVQCRYTVKNPEQSLRTRLMNVALLAFNVLRPRGRSAWGLSVGIAGNGWGVSADTLRAVPYTARSVVEDLEYHLALVRSGRAVQFLDDTYVLGDMPTGGKGADTQRARWEGGRFRMIREHVPPLVSAVLQGNWRLIEPLLELLLLPLALHVLLILPLVILPLGFTQIYGVLAFALVLLHVLVGIWVGGGGIKDLMALATAPLYIIWKLTLLPLMMKTATKNATWVRTEREPKEPKS